MSSIKSDSSVSEVDYQDEDSSSTSSKDDGETPIGIADDTPEMSNLSRSVVPRDSNNRLREEEVAVLVSHRAKQIDKGFPLCPSMSDDMRAGKIPYTDSLDLAAYELFHHREEFGCLLRRIITNFGGNKVVQEWHPKDMELPYDLPMLGVKPL